jgi:hypothetical protein
VVMPDIIGGYARQYIFFGPNGSEVLSGMINLSSNKNTR